MNSLQNKPLVIYVSGPYSPQTPETDPAKRQAMIEQNIENANQTAIDIAKKGHLPFVPHTMMRGWEGPHFSREKAMDICFKWVEKCDALFFIGPSAGAEAERELAVRLNKPVYRNLEDISDLSNDTSSALSPEALQLYVLEYEQCMESYRHTYDTIWQAGGLFAAISAAIITFAQDTSLRTFSLLPVILWFIGIFTPMNRYGEVRNDRIVALEKKLNVLIPDLEMRHFIEYSDAHKPPKKSFLDPLRNIFLGKWRVSQAITVFGVLLILFQIYWIYINYQVLFPKTP